MNIESVESVMQNACVDIRDEFVFVGANIWTRRVCLDAILYKRQSASMPSGCRSEKSGRVFKWSFNISQEFSAS
jgi:hypothetical protein